MSSNEKITMRQLQILIILSAMGTGFIVLPRRAAEVLPGSEQNAWMIALGLTALAVAIGALVCTAVRASVNSVSCVKQGVSFIEYTSLLLTKPAAYVLGAALWVKLVLSAGLEMRVFIEITREVLLPQTPRPVVGGAMLALCAYAAARGIETRARVAEVLLALMVLPFLFLFVIGLIDADFSNLRPAFAASPRELASGTFRLGYIFTGLECLLLVSAFVPREKNMRRPVVGALGLAGLIITAVTIVTIATFGRAVAEEPWPVLRMMDMLNLPGSFIERQEALVFSFWIITAFALGNALIFFGGVLVKDIGQTRLRTGVFMSAAAVFAVTLLPLTKEDIYRFLDSFYITAGLFFLVALPIILLAAARIHKWGQRRMFRRSTMLILILVTVIFTFASCFDRVEIENRAFVVAIGIDKAEDETEGKYNVTLSIPILGGQDEDGEGEGPSAHIKSATGHTLVEALKKLDAKTDKRLYYGQTKMLILGTNLLSDRVLVNSVVKTLYNEEIDRRIHVLAAENPEKILDAKPPGENTPGMYVSEIYRDNKKIGGTTFALDFQRLYASNKDGGALIPIIEENKDELRLNGAVLLKNSEIAGKLTHDELRGFLWAFPGGGKGAVVNTSKKGSQEKTSLKVESHSVKIDFESTASPSALRVTIDVGITGKLNTEDKKLDFSREIADEITRTGVKLQNEYALDGYDFLEQLRKKNYKLYLLYAEDWDVIFPKIEILPRVGVEISYV